MNLRKIYPSELNKEKSNAGPTAAAKRIVSHLSMNHQQIISGRIPPWMKIDSSENWSLNRAWILAWNVWFNWTSLEKSINSCSWHLFSYSFNLRRRLSYKCIKLPSSPWEGGDPTVPLRGSGTAVCEFSSWWGWPAGSCSCIILDADSVSLLAMVNYMLTPFLE